MRFTLQAAYYGVNRTGKPGPKFIRKVLQNNAYSNAFDNVTILHKLLQKPQDFVPTENSRVTIKAHEKLSRFKRIKKNSMKGHT